MKEPSKAALHLARQFIGVVETSDDDKEQYAVVVGGNGMSEGVCEFFHSEHLANKTCLHLLWILGHFIDVFVNRALADFYREVDTRAQQNIVKTGTVSGAHYNAMKSILKEKGIDV